MPRQTLAERITASVLVELHAVGVYPEPLDLSDEDFEHLALKVQEHLDDAAERMRGLLDGNGGKTHGHLRRRRDSGVPRERGQSGQERRGKHR